MSEKRIKKLLVKTKNLELLKLAKKVAISGGDTALDYFRASNLPITNKNSESFDPVTEADLKAEMVMRNLIARERPKDSILGEEQGFSQGSSDYTWVLDPIDGTRAFISGVPVWTVLVSVKLGVNPILGVIYQPFTKELFLGGLGISEVVRSGFVSSLKTRKCLNLEDSILFTTFPEIGSLAERGQFELLKSRAKLTRYGIDAYAYALLALGQIDIVLEAGLKPHDVQAPIAIIESAGGIVTNWTGGSAKDGGKVLATGSDSLHNKVLNVLSQKFKN
jgi:histidinol phosphatase-like enzyme (inositol monophosphatase family)